MTKRGFEVIVSRCDSAGLTAGDNILRQLIPDLPTAHQAGMPHKAKGKVVILRPNFNENGLFREWRSFNGNPWQECRWDHR